MYFKFNAFFKTRKLKFLLCIENKSNIKPKDDYVNPCVNFANIYNLNLRGLYLQDKRSIYEQTENQRDLDRYLKEKPFS